MGWGLESLQASFEEVQGLEKEGGAGPTDGATQESFDHRMQLQGKRTLGQQLCRHGPQPSPPETSQLLSRGGLENRPVVLCITFPLQRREKCSQE